MMSRPGMWGVTSAVYMFAIPSPSELRAWTLWLGLAIVVVPMNFIACAWNDLRDADVDAHCKRKTTQDNLLVNAFGMAYTADALPKVARIIALSTATAAAGLAWAGASVTAIALFVASFLLANASYNEQPLQLSRRGPFELVIVVYVYLHALFVPSMLSHLPVPSAALVAIAALYIASLQLAGEITDMKTDEAQGKITTAVLLGQTGATWACRGLIAVLLGLTLWTEMYGLALVSAIGLAWSLIPTRRARARASVLYVIFALYSIVWLLAALIS